MKQLELKRQFDASAERLFDCFASAEALEQWFGPGAMTIPQAQADFRVGGRYRIVMRETTGEEYIVGGQYLRIERPELIEMDWKWEHGEVTSRVLLEFRDLGDQRSELALHHSGFEDQSDADAHTDGWTGGLDNLRTHLARATA